MLQQEEQQRQVLEGMNFSSDSSTLLSKNMDMRNVDVKCSECGNKDHTSDKCWHVIGFPSWHPRARRHPQNQRRGGKSFSQGARNFRPRGEASNWRGATQVEMKQSVYSQK